MRVVSWSKAPRINSSPRMAGSLPWPRKPPKAPAKFRDSKPGGAQLFEIIRYAKRFVALRFLLPLWTGRRNRVVRIHLSCLQNLVLHVLGRRKIHHSAHAVRGGHAATKLVS